jgi:type II secretory pathway pseudopilin PulG
VTLVEIVVAVAVIAIGLVGVASVVPVSSSGVQEGGQLSTATFLAEQMIERARAAAWSAAPAIDCLGVSAGDAAPVPSGATCHGGVTTRFPDETSVSGHPGFRRTVRVAACDAAPGCAGVVGEGLRRAVVTVRYTPLATGGVAPAPRAIQLEWLASRR